MMNVFASNPDDVAATEPLSHDTFRFNQLGYFSTGPKRALYVLTDKDDHTQLFRLVDATTGEECYRKELTKPNYWKEADDWTAIADFSDFTVPGRYRLEVPVGRLSSPFVIRDSIYGNALNAAARMYFYQRASKELLPLHAGEYARAAGHLNDAAPFHSDLNKPAGAQIATPGGWYDAGDYGKYVVNAGVTTSLLMMSYDRFGALFPDGSLNLPESGNGVSDLLDEISYELDWLITMQDQDGGVFFKVTPLRFAPHVMPADDLSVQYVIGKSTSSTLNFAAVMAYAAYLYQSVDIAFAEQCLRRAEAAWAWALEHPDIAYTQGPDSPYYKDVRTGAYGDRHFDDEFFWARVALSLASGKEAYALGVEHLPQAYSKPSWRHVGGLGYFAILSHPDQFADEVVQRAAQHLQIKADSILQEVENHAARIHRFGFGWGSNQDPLNAIITLSFAFKIEQSTKYISASIELMDYIFGKNAVGYCFVTGFGEKSPKYPHHRVMKADQIESPIPGFLVGGPNRGIQDRAGLEQRGIDTDVAPAKAYFDHSASYASNEVAINWNAPLVYALSFLEYYGVSADE